jgi:hypothetical protein
VIDDDAVPLCPADEHLRDIQRVLTQLPVRSAHPKDSEVQTITAFRSRKNSSTPAAKSAERGFGTPTARGPDGTS